MQTPYLRNNLDFLKRDQKRFEEKKRRKFLREKLNTSPEATTLMCSMAAVGITMMLGAALWV